MPAQKSGSPTSVWVLLGTKHGDNRQLLAIAEAMRRPFRSIPLQFGVLAALPPALLGKSRLSWRSETPLMPPWPSVVLAAGRKSVAAALWIRHQSGGHTRLVHVNRPWAPLSWFDLIVTTPQYALPRRDNVLPNLLPFGPAPAPAPSAVELSPPWRARAEGMSRPWTVVLIGGDSRPYVLDAAAATRLGEQVAAEVRTSGGSAWVLCSPRTPSAATTAVERALDVPSQVVRWNEADNPYRALLGLADRFMVTADSASMLADALASGRSVQPLELPRQPDWRWHLAAACRAAAQRAPASSTARAYDALVDLGLLSSVRDVGLLREALARARAFDGGEQFLDVLDEERRTTLARIVAVTEGTVGRMMETGVARGR